MGVAAIVTTWAVGASGTPAPTPSGTGRGMPDPDIVTPGALGFVIMFVLAVAIWLLLRNLTGRLRRMRYREEQRLRAEQLAAAEEEDRRWAQEQAAKTAATRGRRGTRPDPDLPAGADSPPQGSAPSDGTA